MVFSSSQKKGGYVTEKQSLVQDCKSTLNMPWHRYLLWFCTVSCTYCDFTHM
ncbi:hypothetical protein N474_07580 [Pseudoalteromonas luteoviolacea CPMOR-2]|uniref:Uncharacterized protein n=1 Tax=Pseudoalteromonas luteoviolacea DSM 6061 TaxID=1365250 RepID=A0A166X3P0_9GAMM|nr:hypothetical protein N475_14190 [Pseudoalteromonas luteoviolacea DSM 6061]KZN57832.1 hypothetical protein N474_07580 [Pseudoalteromonas luteoviolacea CPMOR-2]MBE0388386.1 hypothetical protein [Pseudoalteromonas luteoviolacea DSM 6061]